MESPLGPLARVCIYFPLYFQRNAVGTSPANTFFIVGIFNHLRIAGLTLLALLLCLGGPALAAPRLRTSRVHQLAGPTAQPRARGLRGLLQRPRRALKRLRLRALRHLHHSNNRRTVTQRPVGKRPTVLSQLARGLARGAKDTWKEIKAHPVRTLAVTVGIGALSIGLEALSLPAQPILLGLGALLTAKGVVDAWPRLRRSFAEQRQDRFAVVGETAFPMLAFGLATGICQGLGAWSKGLTGSSARVAGAGRAVALGLHVVDDLPAATTLLRTKSAR